MESWKQTCLPITIMQAQGKSFMVTLKISLEDGFNFLISDKAGLRMSEKLLLFKGVRI